MLKIECADRVAFPLFCRSMGIQLRKNAASTYTGGVALCAHKAHHLVGGSSVLHWFLGAGVEKSEKIAVSRGARLCAHGQD